MEEMGDVNTGFEITMSDRCVAVVKHAQRSDDVVERRPDLVLAIRLAAAMCRVRATREVAKERDTRTLRDDAQCRRRRCRPCRARAA